MQNLPDSLPRPLAERWPLWSQGRQRRKHAALKLDFYSEMHLQRVRQRIVERVDEDSVDEVLAFASRAPNLLRAVVDAVAVCYRHGCRRELADLGEGAAKAFAEVVAESGVDRLAFGLNAKAWLLGPTLVTPYLDARNRVALDVITSERDDVRRSNDIVQSAVWWADGGWWVELDAEGWKYFAPNGEDLGRTPHHVGYCPAVALRAGDAIDWWGAHEHMGLADASLDVAYKLALGLWTRQVSSNRLTTVYGDIEGIAPGQTISHPAKPLVLGPRSRGFDVSVQDRTVNPREYLEEIQAVTAMGVAPYGLLPSDVVFQTGSTGDALSLTGSSITIRGDRLAVLRDRQVPWLRYGEFELWCMVCDMLRGSVHRHARVLPPGDEVRDALRLGFPELVSYAERKARTEALEVDVKFGLDSPVNALLASRPELTRAEAEAEIDANRLAEIERAKQLAQHNQPAELGKVPESIAQLQGRLGGQQSGVVRREESEK